MDQKANDISDSRFILYHDRDIAVCLKPAGVVSTDEAGGMPELIRRAFHNPALPVKTVHRLDTAVSGLMVYALSDRAAAALSREITDGSFEKTYLAVVHGCPEATSGRYTDLLFKDSKTNRSFVVKRPRKGVREAVLDYELVGKAGDLSLVKIRLLTGRTHQIRVQFSSRKMPLVGDRKYGAKDDGGQIGLWSWRLSFTHPSTGEALSFTEAPPETGPWISFGLPAAGSGEIQASDREGGSGWQ